MTATEILRTNSSSGNVTEGGNGDGTPDASKTNRSIEWTQTVAMIMVTMMNGMWIVNLELPAVYLGGDNWLGENYSRAVGTILKFAVPLLYVCTGESYAYTTRMREQDYALRKQVYYCVVAKGRLLLFPGAVAYALFVFPRLYLAGQEGSVEVNVDPRMGSREPGLFYYWSLDTYQERWNFIWYYPTVWLVLCVNYLYIHRLYRRALFFALIISLVILGCFLVAHRIWESIGACLLFVSPYVVWWLVQEKLAYGVRGKRWMHMLFVGLLCACQLALILVGWVFLEQREERDVPLNVAANIVNVMFANYYFLLGFHVTTLRLETEEGDGLVGREGWRGLRFMCGVLGVAVLWGNRGDTVYTEGVVSLVGTWAMIYVLRGFGEFVFDGSVGREDSLVTRNVHECVKFVFLGHWFWQDFAIRFFVQGGGDGHWMAWNAQFILPMVWFFSVIVCVLMYFCYVGVLVLWKLVGRRIGGEEGWEMAPTLLTPSAPPHPEDETVSV